MAAARVNRIGTDFIVVSTGEDSVIAKRFGGRMWSQVKRYKPMMVPPHWWLQPQRASHGFRVLFEISSSNIVSPIGCVWPLGNSFAPGSICWGKNPRPRTMEEAEHLFFNTRFTYIYRQASFPEVKASGGLQQYLDNRARKYNVIDEMKALIAPIEHI